MSSRAPTSSSTRRRARTVRPDALSEPRRAARHEPPDHDAVAGDQAVLPDAEIISVANPLDASSSVSTEAEPAKHKLMAWPAPRLGRYQLLRGAGRRRVGGERRGMVLGGHGDDMVRSAAAAGGRPAVDGSWTRRRSRHRGEDRKAGGEIVGLIGVSAFWSPAIAAIEMVEAIVYDKRRSSRRACCWKASTA